MDYFNHGVAFKPDNLEKVVYDLDKLDKSYTYVRIYWVDFANLRRCRVLPIHYFRQLLASNRPGVNIAKVCLGLIDLVTSPGFSSIGEYLYAPDLSTLRPLPFANGHLGVLGFFQEKTPYKDVNGSTSVQVDLCPRTVLKRIVNDAKQSCGVDFLVGFESEFILLSSTNPVVTPSNVHQWSSPAGFLAGSKEAAILDEIGNAMTASGLSLHLIHAEAAPGQYEVVGGPLSPLDAADQLVFTRELIVNVTARHGLHATFAPRPFLNSTGSAAHAHISVHSADERGNKPVNELSKHESAFLTGLLDHLPAIPAITLPTPASYKRMMDGVWSGGTYVHYGTENREAPIRLTNPTSPDSRNFEIRFIDGTANPYLALAAIVGAGLSGLKTMKPLVIKDCPGPRCAWEMTEEERRALGINKRMPLNIEEARKNLVADQGMKEILGDVLVEKYISVNKTLGSILPEEQEGTAQLTQLVEFY